MAFLNDAHKQDLLKSGLSADTIMRSLIYSAPETETRAILGFGVGTGMVIPYPKWAGRSTEFLRVKMDKKGPDGKRGYRTAKGSGNHVYVPANFDQTILADPSKPLYLTEGEKKALKACQEGLATIALPGVWSWRGRLRPGDKTSESVVIEDFDHIEWNGRLVVIVFDYDPKPDTARDVEMAEQKLAAKLRGRGAAVKIVRLPAGPNGEKRGLDDYLVAHDPASLQALIDEAEVVGGADDLHRPTGNTTLLPTIQVPDRRLSDKTADAIRAIKAANGSDPKVFSRDGVITRLRFDRNRDGAPVVEPLGVDALRGVLDTVALWVKDHDKITDPPTSVVRNLLAQADVDLPPLRSVVETPFVTRDGRVVVTTGYHADAQVVLHLPAGLTIPPIPSTPATEEVARAVALLSDMVYDFPFASEADRAHAFAALVTPLVRDFIASPIPLFGIDAPMPGTGKGLLTNAIAIIVTGRPINVMTKSPDEVETRKLITSVLLAGGPLALFDNVTRKIASGVLSALLTSEGKWQDRILGESRVVHLDNHTLWIATGNNLAFSTEVLRRTVWIRMDARHPRPHLRQGFRHDPLLAWVAQQRGALIWAAMTLVQNWFAAGQRPFTTRRLGSFERWSGIVGGILEAAGVPGFLSNLESFAAKADDDAADWTAFIGAWWERYTTTPVTTRALHLLARDTFPALLGDGKTEKAEQTKLGGALKERTGWVFDLGSGLTVMIRRVVPTDKEAPHDEGDDRRRKRPGWALTTDARRDSDAGPSRSGQVRSQAATSDADESCGGPDPVPDLSPRPVTCGTTSGHEEGQEPQAVTETTAPDRTCGLPDDSEVPF